MAQMYSEDSTRELGGDWGWVDDKTLSAPLTSRSAFKPQAGRDQQSRRTSAATTTFSKWKRARAAKLKPLKDVRAEIEARLRQEQAQELQEHWIASLRSKAYIKTF